MLITYFEAKEIGKVPYSKNNIFEFHQKEVNLKNVYLINKDYWILNGNFKFDKIPFKSKRNKFYLNDYLTENFEFIIIDLDGVNSKVNVENIINILKKENLSFSIWNSSSYNNIDNFNLKGIIQLRGKNNEISRLKAIQYIDNLIKDFCKVDYSSVRPVATQKPVHKILFQYTNNGNNIPEFYFENIKIDYVSDNELLNLCIKTYESLGYYICNENDKIINLAHPKEKTKCGYFIFKNNPIICHHFNKQKTFSIFDLIKNDPIFKKYNQKKLEENFEKKLYYSIKNKIIFNQRYINIEELNIKDIENNEVIYVKSPMGTGKTNFIKKLEKNKRTLIITNRITLAEEYKEKFPHFKLYNKDYYCNGDSLIVQFDSLHKYDLQNFDFFIIDEFMSLIEHSLSGLTDYKHINNLKLFFILQKLKEPLLIMDAFLTGIETKLVKRKKFRYYENIYRDDNKLFIYEDINKFICKIETLLKEKDKKITLSTTNKSFGKIIYELFKENHKVVLLTGDTENKNDYTKYFGEKFHNKWDLLIYTPTITTGINILNESDHHFHYSDGTGSVISSLQQLKRNRNAKNIHFYLKGKIYNKSMDYDELLINIQNKLKEFTLKNSLMVDFDKYANPILNDFGKFHLQKIYISNILNNNSLFSFKFLLKEQFKNNLTEEKNCNKNYNIKQILKNIKEKEKIENLKKIEDLINSSSFDFRLIYETDFKDIKEKFDKYFINLSENDIKELVQIINSDKSFLKNINYLKIYFYSEEKIKEIISNVLLEKFNTNLIKNLELIYQFKKKNILLKNIFTKKDLKYKNMSKFLKLIGYTKKDGNYILKENIKKFLNKIKY